MTVEEAVKRGVEVDDAEYEKQLSRKEKLAVSASLSFPFATCCYAC
jgi:hypothetical protein